MVKNEKIAKRLIKQALANIHKAENYLDSGKAFQFLLSAENKLYEADEQIK